MLAISHLHHFETSMASTRSRFKAAIAYGSSTSGFLNELKTEVRRQAETKTNIGPTAIAVGVLEQFRQDARFSEVLGLLPDVDREEKEHIIHGILYVLAKNHRSTKKRHTNETKTNEPEAQQQEDRSPVEDTKPVPETIAESSETAESESLWRARRAKGKYEFLFKHPFRRFPRSTASRTSSGDVDVGQLLAQKGLSSTVHQGFLSVFEKLVSASPMLPLKDIPDKFYLRTYFGVFWHYCHVEDATSMAMETLGDRMQNVLLFDLLCAFQNQSTYERLKNESECVELDPLPTGEEAGTYVVEHRNSAMASRLFYERIMEESHLEINLDEASKTIEGLANELDFVLKAKQTKGHYISAMTRFAILAHASPHHPAGIS